MALAVALVILVVLRVAKLRVARLLALPTMGGVLGAILVLGAWLLLIRG